MLVKISAYSAPSILQRTQSPPHPPFSFLYSALCRGIVPGYLPQLQPDADTGATGHGSESPGSVKCQFKYSFHARNKVWYLCWIILRYTEWAFTLVGPRWHHENMFLSMRFIYLQYLIHFIAGFTHYSQYAMYGDWPWRMQCRCHTFSRMRGMPKFPCNTRWALPQGYIFQ